MTASHPIRRYTVTGTLGGSTTYEADLCQYHANIKKTFSREVKELAEAPSDDAKCEDCRPARGPYVIDRVIDSDDDDTEPAPVPVPVLPGQGKLFP
jgi:hypothetical protein